MSKILRGYEKQILLNNAYESWIQAIASFQILVNTSFSSEAGDDAFKHFLID